MVRHDGPGEINTWFQEVPARASSTTPVSRVFEHEIHPFVLGRVPGADGLVECFGLEFKFSIVRHDGPLAGEINTWFQAVPREPPPRRRFCTSSNMPSMSVTAAVSQSPMDWLNAMA
jgi:hypothetical protein